MLLKLEILSGIGWCLYGQLRASGGISVSVVCVGAALGGGKGFDKIHGSCCQSHFLPFSIPFMHRSPCQLSVLLAHLHHPAEHQLHGSGSRAGRGEKVHFDVYFTFISALCWFLSIGMKAAFKSSHTRERVLFFKFGDLTFKVLNDLCWLGMSTRALHTRFLCVLPVQMSCRCYQSYKVSGAVCHCV